MLLKGTSGKNFEATIRLKTDEGIIVWQCEGQHGSWGDMNFPHQCRPGDYITDVWTARCDGATLELQDIQYVGEPPYGREKRSQTIRLHALSNFASTGPSWYVQPGPVYPELEYRCTTLADLADFLKQRDRERKSKIRAQEIDQQNQVIKKCLGTLGIDDPEILKMF
jgi:hypothetical protein